MNIVILDGKTTNPGDISWKEITSLGNVKIYDDSSATEVIDRAKNADCIISNRIILNEEVLSKLPNLKYIGTLSTGFNTIDLSFAKSKGITVSNVPFYCVNTVAQCAFSLILQLTNHVSKHSELVKSNKWDESIKRSNADLSIFDLQHKTLGIIGYGNIGKTLAQMAKAFGMNVLIYSKNKKHLSFETQVESLEDLFENSDIISINCALNEDTYGMVNMNLISKMKKHGMIVNTARGAIINEIDLAKALNDGIISGAALDVLSEEPPKSDHPLLSAKNCFITPHIAWSSKDARKRLISVVAENLNAFINGNAQNVVNP